MDAARLDALSRSLSAPGSRRRVLSGVLAGALAPLVSVLPAEASDKAKKHRRQKKRRQKKTVYNASKAYNICLTSVPLMCAAAGCADRNQSPGCASCFSDIEACCQQALISDGAECACINSLPDFFCFSG
jgi:hypothetical protein